MEMTEDQIKEMCKIAAAIDEFSAVMRDRMKEKLLQGYSGWDDPEKVSNVVLAARIYEDAEQMDLGSGTYEEAIDVANRCMMLWFRGR